MHSTAQGAIRHHQKLVVLPSARPEHPNTDEAEGNDLENNFMKMIEVLKEDFKNFLK